MLTAADGRVEVASDRLNVATSTVQYSGVFGTADDSFALPPRPKIDLRFDLISTLQR